MSIKQLNWKYLNKKISFRRIFWELLYLRTTTMKRIFTNSVKNIGVLWHFATDRKIYIHVMSKLSLFIPMFLKRKASRLSSDKLNVFLLHNLSLAKALVTSNVEKRTLKGFNFHRQLMQLLAKLSGFSEACGLPITSGKIVTKPDLMEVVTGNLFPDNDLF